MLVGTSDMTMTKSLKPAGFIVSKEQLLSENPLVMFLLSGRSGQFKLSHEDLHRDLHFIFQSVDLVYLYHFTFPNLTEYTYLNQAHSSTDRSLRLYQIVKQNVTQSVPDKAFFHTRNTAFRAYFAP